MKLLAWFDRPERFFLVLGAGFGLLSALLFPPFQVIDEGSHFDRAYQIASGGILGTKNITRSGGYLPKSIRATQNDYDYLTAHYDAKIRLGVVAQDLRRPLEPGDIEFDDFANTSIYPPLTYAPQATAIAVTRLWSAPPLVSLYAARLAGLAFWLLLAYWSIRLLPVGKWAAVALYLTPIMVAQGASASADCTINAVCVFAVGLLVRAVVTHKLTPRKLIALGGTGLALSLIKLPYVLVMALVFAIPAKAFPVPYTKWRFVAALGAIVVLPIVIWSALSAPIHADLLSTLSLQKQTQRVLHHPQAFMKAVVSYPFTFRMDETIRQLYGRLGWEDIRLPLWGAYAAALAFALGLMERPAVAVSRRLRLWAAGASVALTGAITLLIYLTWIPVGLSYLYGLAGRYFVVAVALAIPALSGFMTLDIRSWPRAKPAIKLIVIVNITVTLAFIWNRYYYHLSLS